MLLQKSIVLSVFCLLSVCTLAQQRPRNGSKSSYTRERFNYNATRVRGNKAKIVCPVFDKSKYPYHGFGVKMGDPFALTYKYYPNKNFAIAADVGKPASGLYNRYFRQQFNTYQRDTLSQGAQVNYLTHTVKSDFIGELKLLYHIDAKFISPGLQFYVGAGWEWKYSKIRYDYVYDEPDNPNPNSNNRIGNFTVSRFTQGPQGVIGIEYSYFQLPISAFMELEYFTDVQLDPGWSRAEGGVGLRYIF
ncbi:MAG TPA: hypothetical protein VIN08_16020 [Ohtaekwangia sp.]|uniref:hypothetical protein n=1 Tax=Ohtaekwangia sp. TaxID=2066019 RepID=UPI002F934DD4